MNSGHLRRAVAALGAAAGLVVLGGCGGGVSADRSVAIGAHNYAYTGLDGFSGRAGEKVEFVLTNAGPADHEFEVFGPDGKGVGEVGPTSAGASRKATLDLSKPGTYRFRCGVADHESRGMFGTFVVR
jgi:uncharacterized cupredoxin-like copper-binding protein